MEKLSGLIVAAVVLLFVGTGVSQSLADQAKVVRQQKKSPTKVYTEDDLLSVPVSKMAEESHAAEATAANAEAAKENPAAENSASGDAEKKDEANPSDKKGDDAAAKEEAAKAKEASEAAAKEWKSKIEDQEQEIKALEKEVDLMQRENKLHQASYYGDAGNQLRDQKAWADEQRQYQTDLEAKQKAIAEAKEKLDDAREQARKSGVPSSQAE
jgi:hypothetical protein